MESTDLEDAALIAKTFLRRFNMKSSRHFVGTDWKGKTRRTKSQKLNSMDVGRVDISC